MPVKQEKNSKLIEAQIVVGENIINRMEVITFTIEKEIENLRDVKVSVKNIKWEIIPNSVILNGNIEIQLFYLDTQKKIHKEYKEMTFNYVVDIPGADTGMEVLVEPTVEQILSAFTSESSLEQKVFLQFFIKVLSLEKLMIETGKGPLVEAKHIVSEHFFNSLILNDVNLAVKAVEVFDIKAKTEILQTSVKDGNLLIAGKIHKDLLYLAEDGVEHHQDEDIPFQIKEEIPCLEEGLDIHIDLEIEELEYNLNSSGRNLSQSIIMNIRVKLSEYHQINVVTGNNALLMFSEVIGESTEKIKNEIELTLDQSVEELEEIKASFEELKTILLNDKVLIKGVINIQISYIGKDATLYYQLVNNPITEYIDIEGVRPGMRVEVLANISFEKPVLLEKKKIILEKSVLDISVKVTEDIQFHVNELSI
ncbi:DUF3794 domain-containing protein [Natronospora cellulosivora (SeqCode)]